MINPRAEAPIFNFNLGPHPRAESRAQEIDVLRQVVMNVASGRYRLGIVRENQLIQRVRIGLGVNISAQEAEMDEAPSGATITFPLQKDGERMSLTADLGIAEAALKMYISEDYTVNYRGRELSFYDHELLLKTFALLDFCLQNSLFVDATTGQKINVRRSRLTSTLRGELERTITDLRSDFTTSSIPHEIWLTSHYPEPNIILGATTGEEDRDRIINPLIEEAIENANVSNRRRLRLVLAHTRNATRRAFAEYEEISPLSLDVPVTENGKTFADFLVSSSNTSSLDDSRIVAFLQEYGLGQIESTIFLRHFLDGRPFNEIDHNYRLAKGQASAVIHALQNNPDFMQQLYAKLREKAS